MQKMQERGLEFKADCSQYIYAAHWIIVIECIDYVN